MKLNELINDFRIFMTNEEKVELDKLNAPTPYASLTTSHNDQPNTKKAGK